MNDFEILLKKFENKFAELDCIAPDVYYIVGEPYSYFIIAKREKDEYYQLYAMDHRRNLNLLKHDTFENLIRIINMFIPLACQKIYYECLAE